MQQYSDTEKTIRVLTEYIDKMFIDLKEEEKLQCRICHEKFANYPESVQAKLIRYYRSLVNHGTSCANKTKRKHHEEGS